MAHRYFGEKYTLRTILQSQEGKESLEVEEVEHSIYFALTTGMRQGELLALKWSDLDLIYGTLQVQRTLRSHSRLWG